MRTLHYSVVEGGNRWRPSPLGRRRGEHIPNGTGQPVSLETIARRRATPVRCCVLPKLRSAGLQCRRRDGLLRSAQGARCRAASGLTGALRKNRDPLPSRERIGTPDRRSFIRRWLVPVRSAPGRYSRSARKACRSPPCIRRRSGGPSPKRIHGRGCPSLPLQDTGWPRAG